MQKKIIALAIAGLASTAAFAQSNVTIYGIADVGVAQLRASGNQQATQVVSGGLSTSRIGFKGVEDLGNGLKAIFNLEYRLDIDKNTGIGGNYANETTVASGPARQQYVGLTGGFGTAVAGRLQTTAFDWQVKYITLGATALDVTGALESTTASGFRITPTRDIRASNAVAYISPSFGGVTVALNHAQAVEQAAGVANGAATDGQLGATMIGVYYDNGPLSVGFVGSRLDGNGNNSNLDATKRTDLGLGASYDFKVVKLTATYQTTKNDKFTAAAGLEDKRDAVWQLGVQVPVSAKGTVLAAYSGQSINSTTASDNGKGLSVAYAHALSKRTTAYAGYAWTDNASGAATVGVGGVPTNLGGQSSVLAAGLRHAF